MARDEKDVAIEQLAATSRAFVELARENGLAGILVEQAEGMINYFAGFAQES
jgi:hypothetical protein